MLSAHAQGTGYPQVVSSQRSAAGTPSYQITPTASTPHSSFPGAQYVGGGGQPMMFADSNRLLQHAKTKLKMPSNN
jgi:hypothetical protein